MSGRHEPTSAVLQSRVCITSVTDKVPSTVPDSPPLPLKDKIIITTLTYHFHLQITFTPEISLSHPNNPKVCMAISPFGRRTLRNSENINNLPPGPDELDPNLDSVIFTPLTNIY
jgi:hypothetical protein